MYTQFSPGVKFLESELPEINMCKALQPYDNILYKFRYKTQHGCYAVAVINDTLIPSGYDFVLSNVKNNPVNTNTVTPQLLHDRGWIYFSVLPLNVYEVADIERIALYMPVYQEHKEKEKDCGTDRSFYY